MPDDDTLNIDAEDLTDEPLPPVRPDTGPVLDVSLDDLTEEVAEPGAFPALTADQLTAAQHSITIRTLCSSTGQPFLVRYVEDKPGVFVTHEVTPEDGGAGVSSPAPAGAGTVTGQFGTSKDYACPFCGSRAILVCGSCGADLCAGPSNSNRCTCPSCKTQIQVGGRATSATGLLGGKGKAKGK